MSTDNESFNRDLYDLLKVRGYQPVPLDSKNQRVPASQSADVIQFTFNKDGKDYGKAWISIDDTQNVIIYYDEEQQESPSTTTPGVEYDDSWTGFLKHVKNWAQRRQLSFELSNKDRLGDDMRQRDYYKMKERVSEGYHPMGKKASYNDAVPSVKIILQHNRALEEGEQRYRNVAKIFLENQEGERFLAPTTRPGIARVYARHIAEGGVPNDDKWNHIKSICEDYNKMAGFVRATRNNQFNESAQELVNEGINHYNNLRETLHKLATHRGYQNYFESWTPALMEDELDESINDLFVQEMVDPRIESAMPILSRLKKPVTEMSEVDSLAEWADGIINEKLELDEPENNVVPLKRRKPSVTVLAKDFDDEFGHYDELGRIGKIASINRGAEDDMDWDDDSWIPDEEDFEDEEMARELSRHRGRFAANDIGENFIGMDPQAVAEEEVEEGMKDTIKKGVKSLKRGMKGWEKGMHDVDTVKAATKTLSPDSKEAILKSKVGKGSPAELQQKLIKREKNKQVDEVLDTRDAKMSYAQKNMDSHKKALDDYMHYDGEGQDADKKADAHKTAMKRVRGLQTFMKNKVSKDEDVTEDLGPEQKRVGQLGPIGGPAKVGDLVGANESTEFADELSRIIDIARFNR